MADISILPLRPIDRRITTWMARIGLPLLRIALGIVFLWFGALIHPEPQPGRGPGRAHDRDTHGRTHPTLPVAAGPRHVGGRDRVGPARRALDAGRAPPPVRP